VRAKAWLQTRQLGPYEAKHLLLRASVYLCHYTMERVSSHMHSFTATDLALSILTSVCELTRLHLLACVNRDISAYLDAIF
jgi:hypothetical protein